MIHVKYNNSYTNIKIIKVLLENFKFIFFAYIDLDFYFFSHLKDYY